jgi:hypothetical protein
MERDQITKNGTDIAISLEEVSNVQQIDKEPCTLTNVYLCKVFDTVTKYYRVNADYVNREIGESSLANLKDNKTKGVISPKTKKRVNRALYAWSRIIKAYNEQNAKIGIRDRKHLVMITLTLPCKQLHDDKYIKRNLLGYFIVLLERTYNMHHYFWRAEVQNNGRIHFHFITDLFIKYLDIKKFWNLCLEINGYLEEYEKTTGRKDPPSTHVKSISESDQELYYSLKYTLKNEETREIDGYVFGYSDTLRNIHTPIISMTNELNSILNRLELEASINTIVEEYYSVYYIKKEFMKPSQLEELDEIIKKEYDLQVDILY